MAWKIPLFFRTPLKEIVERHCLTIETLKKAVKNNKISKGTTISEKSFVFEKKIKDLNAELREQRAKTRQLKSELSAFQENSKQASGDIGLSDVSGVVNIKITKGTEISNHRKTSKGTTYINLIPKSKIVLNSIMR